MKSGDHLNIIWINAPLKERGSEEEETFLNIPIQEKIDLSEILVDIFNRTTEIAKSVDPNFIPSEFFYSRLVQLIKNETFLSPDEYKTPIEHFTNSDVQIYLNTRHCGQLILRVADENGEPLGVLNLDYGKDSFEGVAKKIQTEIKVRPDYIYTESSLYFYPGMEKGKYIRDELGQFSEVRCKQRLSPSEIVITVRKVKDGQSFTLFIDSSMKIEEIKQLLESMTGIEVKKQRLTVNDETILDNLAILKDGDIIDLSEDSGFGSFGIKHGAFAMRIANISGGTSDDSLFADMTGEVELIPKGKKKYEKPSTGLNLQGECKNEDCEIFKERVSLVVPWQFTSFDLTQDAGKVYCPECQNPIKVLSPLFYMTQWKFYGRKMERDESGEEVESKLISWDWQMADDPNNASGFTVVDTGSTDIKIGLADWAALIIMTRQLPKTKTKKPKTEWFNFGLGFSLPLVFKVSLKFDWFRDFD